VILTYVMWITFLAWAIDWLLKKLARRAYPWTEAGL
jgi:NitT/TauT family transport system permease protein